MRFVGDRAPSGATGLTGWIFPSGSSHRHPLDPSGFDGMRPRRFLRDAPEPYATDSFRSLRGRDRAGPENAAVFGLSTSRDRQAPTFGYGAEHGTRGARQSRNTLPSPRRSGPGTPRELARGAKRPARLDGAETRGSIGTRRYQSPWEHRAVHGGNAVSSQRTPRWNKALRSALCAARRGNTGAGKRGTTRGHANW